MNGDGRADVAVVNQYSRTVSLLRNLGTGPLAVEPPPCARAAGLSLRVYPTPAHDEVGVRLALARSADATVRVLDVNGRVIAVLARGAMTAGVHALRWDRRGRDGRWAPPGVYLVDAH